MDELEVPREALLMLESVSTDGGYVDEDDARAIATPMVAAELRRLAEVPEIAETSIRERLLFEADRREAAVRDTA